TSAGFGSMDDADWQSYFGGGAWVDPFNGQWKLSGRLYDGTTTVGYGPCVINCANARSTSPLLGGGDPEQYSAGFYSFPAGGAEAVFCDGSVRFLSENMSNAIFSALVTSKNGEVVGDF